MSESTFVSEVSKKVIDRTLELGKGQLTPSGALLVETGRHTGRAAKERYVVQNDYSQNLIHWGAINQPISQSVSDQIQEKIQSKLGDTQTYEYQGFVGGFPIHVTSTSPWHIAFADNMFRDEAVSSIAQKIQNSQFKDQKINVYHDPYGNISEYGIYGLPTEVSSTLIQLNPETLTVCVIGTAYAGEIKKSAFTLCNFILPTLDVLPMHASANVQRTVDLGGESTVLFGLSGTGKTTLSASPNTLLIGDDEIVWSEGGLSNLEGGCYAKLIDLKEESEPEIYKATNRPGAILENVVLNSKTGKIDYSDRSKTENTRGSYPISSLGEVFPQNKEAKAPKNIIFLTADAFGALPSVAKLNSWQAMYHFMSGYTAKVAGTEMGVKEPKAAFSCCFGAPFMPRPASVYAEMLAKKAKEAGSNFWLLNTGWVGGYGNGERFPIHVSRKLLFEIQSGKLESEPTQTHPEFGFEVPQSCPGVEEKWLQIPQGEHVQSLAKKFKDNFIKCFGDRDECLDIAKEGGPR